MFGELWTAGGWEMEGVSGGVAAARGHQQFAKRGDCVETLAVTAAHSLRHQPCLPAVPNFVSCTTAPRLHQPPPGPHSPNTTASALPSSIAWMALSRLNPPAARKGLEVAVLKGSRDSLCEVTSLSALPLARRGSTCLLCVDGGKCKMGRWQEGCGVRNVQLP